MADADTEITANEEAPKKSKLKLIIIVVVALLLLAGIGGAVWFFFLSSSESEVDDVTELPLEEQVVTPASGIAMYLSLGAEFITSYSTKGGRQRYLQTELSVLARDQETLDNISAQLPLIRNNLLDLLSQQNYDDLRTNEGREALANKLTQAVQEVLLASMGRPGIERVLYRSFVLQ
ncbi:flagellar basal body-associated FliL family protein [Gynuella sp.]|uniref:flagellar basal body-associated FliL family protein n=1 Tax=Gynuella sp. TaxID=2969146 RepID=UPI003D0C2E97